MNKYVLHIVASVICILLPAVGLLYVLWDSNQPKIGPLGDGIPNYPSISQWISIGSSFILGVVNLPLSIIRYRQKAKEDNGQDR
ncbi:hypothetical protein MKY92_16225 [Paenibacillus sp. FSL R5-0623]|uniref:hypothetical protein n=1 Tax=Paenibacillus sp. FSL R5-0623 TaxID=2921651 RepID=UPI0030D6CE30